jgi:protein-disulfide isomerase
LALVAATLVFAGCSGAGSSGSSQTFEEEGQRASKAKLGHPALGSAAAPVVLTEYSDYQ